MTETGSIPPFTVKIYKFQWTTNRESIRPRMRWRSAFKNGGLVASTMIQLHPGDVLAQERHLL